MEFVACPGKSPEPHPLEAMMGFQMSEAHLDTLSFVSRFGECFCLHLLARDITGAESNAANDDDSGRSESKGRRRYERQPPKVISPSDPQSAWTDKRVQFGYGLNYLIDVANAVIVDVEATRSSGRSGGGRVSVGTQGRSGRSNRVRSAPCRDSGWHSLP
jgi:hypothetical protein